MTHQELSQKALPYQRKSSVYFIRIKMKHKGQRIKESFTQSVDGHFSEISGGNQQVSFEPLMGKQEY